MPVRETLVSPKQEVVVVVHRRASGFNRKTVQPTLAASINRRSRTRV
jgi:hypothetical protein